MENQFEAVKKQTIIILGIAILIGLYLVSRYSYLLFHSLAELFSIIIACGIFIVAWNTRRLMDSNYLLFLGIAYLYIAGLDLIHTLGYKGMGVFQGYGANLSAQLWIASRFVESISLLISIFLKVFPDCFVEGAGLTGFKKVSEYLISLILLGSIVFLFQKRQEFEGTVFNL